MSSPTDELFTHTEGYFLTKSLLALWRLGLLDQAANEGRLEPDRVAAECGLDGRLLRAVLDYLVVRGVFVVDDGTYSFSDHGKRLAPYYGYLPMHVGAYEPIFGNLERVLRGELVYGENLRRSEHELVGGMSSMEDALLARLSDLMSEIPFRGVLDMGCGSGRMLSQLLQGSTLRGVGVDRTIEACEKARQNLAADGLADRTTILHGDASKLGDLPADVLAEVDLVIAMFVMHEIHWQQSRAGVIACLRDIADIIGPDGRFLMVEVSRTAGDHARPGLRFIPEYQLVHEFSQQRLAGEDEWREMLDEAGLEVVRTEPAGMCEAFCFVIANRARGAER
jgi:SAM-dependent methyltransferase/predicted transcriptional regulator